MSVFLDTGFILALANDTDQYHKTALKLSELMENNEFGSVFTSDYVFDETVTLAMVRKNHLKAVEIGDFLLDSKIEILAISQTNFDNAWKLFKERKNLSFTDCTIIKIMDENNIKNLATFDKEFKQFKNINVLM